MIPFNKLGWAFHNFGNLVYPKYVKSRLCESLKELPENAKILDIGAGTGTMCNFARECRDDIELNAVDPSLGMLKYCSKDVCTFKGVAEDLPFENSSFDMAIVAEALHHFSDIDKALSEIVRVLKDDGKLFIYDFDPTFLMGKIIAKSEILLGEPGHFYKPDELEKLLNSFNFSTKVYQHSFRYMIVAKLNKN